MVKKTKKMPTRRTAKRPARKVTSRAAKSTRRPLRARASKAKAPKTRAVDPLYAPVKDAQSRMVGHVQLDVGRAGAARVKRMIYPPGFKWSVDMKPVIGGDYCMHAHVGFLVHGEIHVEYPDGCVVAYKAPHVVAIEPGHDGWVVGKEPVVMIEFDFEGETVRRLGMPEGHTHA